MAGIDTALVKIEAELTQKLDKRSKWEEKQKAELDLFNQSIALYSSSNDEVSQSTTEPEFKVMVGGERSQIRKRGRKNILTVDVVASFDRTKTSSRSAVHTLSAALQATEQKVDGFNINRSSIQRARQQHRNCTCPAGNK
jgi:hypothetical protein